MEQLTGFDQSFLNLEGPGIRGHVGGLVILDPTTAPGPLNLDAIRDLIESRLHLLAPFRRRLVEVPFGLDHSYWIEDPHFDIDYHLRHFAVPAPGGPHQLGALVASLHERPLDRSRPLWELYLIEGVEGSKVAIYTKLHHAAIDGMSGADLMTILLDPEPSGRAIPTPKTPWKPDAIPSDWSLLAWGGRALLRRPKIAMDLGVKVFKLFPQISSALSQLGLGRPPEDATEGEAPSMWAPNTRLNGNLTPHRLFAYGAISLARVKAIKNAYGVSVNDVLVTLCAGALRRWLQANDHVPEAPLRALIPISTRGQGPGKEIGNQVTIDIAPIGTHLERAEDRLRFVHEAMAELKERHRAVPATLLQDFAQFTPPAVAAQAARLVSLRAVVERVAAVNVVISNVPGPPFPLYLAGAQLEGHYPVSTIAAGIGLNITIARYLDDLCFGFIADRGRVPNLWSMMDFVHQEVNQLEHEEKARACL